MAMPRPRLAQSARKKSGGFQIHSTSLNFSISAQIPVVAASEPTANPTNAAT